MAHQAPRAKRRAGAQKEEGDNALPAQPPRHEEEEVAV